jgi:hypothetical protein
MLRFPPLSGGGGSWRRHLGAADSALVLVAVGAALLIAWLILVHIALLFQNLFQSTYLLIPGAHLAHDYWRSVDYGVAMAVLVGFFTCLLLLIGALEAVRLVRPRRPH